MNAPVMQNFSYDPFDPAVMADPLSYYRVLRDEHPAYYIEKWDTYALSRFADVWQVLEVNDGTFVASEGTLPAATVLAQHNAGPVPDPPVHPMPFHANFDTGIYDSVRRCTASQFRPKTVSTLTERIRTLANERLDELLPRGTFDLTQDFGGIVAASVVCELVGLPVDLAPEVLATVNAGSLAQPGSGVEVANAPPATLPRTPRNGGRSLPHTPAAMKRSSTWRSPRSSTVFSGQPEILDYFERCAQRYQLAPNLKLHTEIVSARWDGDTKTWRLSGAATTFVPPMAVW
ncbi:MAG: hypothetical protein QOD39_5034 [Mycobacterium sp.]|jgi:cytochrome P450|nr:hypothetical protein [Mycobacterium sp.]